MTFDQHNHNILTVLQKTFEEFVSKTCRKTFNKFSETFISFYCMKTNLNEKGETF